MEIEYDGQGLKRLSPTQFERGRTYFIVPNGKAPYLCCSHNGGHLLLALDTGVLYDPKAFVTSVFVEVPCKVVVTGVIHLDREHKT